MPVAPAVSISATAINNNNTCCALQHHDPSYFDLHVDDQDHQYQHSLPTTPTPSSKNSYLDYNKAPLQRPRPAVITPNRPILSRSLTMPTDIVVPSDENNNSLDPAPGSPPDLSSSKSSLKSASLQSSPSNDDLSDVSHFEEISLTDLHSSKSHPTKGTAAKSRPILRPSYTTQATPTRQARPSNNVRDLTGDLRTTATLNNHAQKHSPRMSWQRNFVPTSPSLSIPLRFGSRTPSPTKSPAMSTSPVSPRNPTPRAENSPILKQGSAQSKRKTQQELEDEYRDSDDEVPDDAVIWNIPLSPRPQNSRSPSISPERGSLKARPGDRGLRFSRTKSWAAALDELSEDAKKLTEALEKHYDHKAQPQNSSSPTSSSASSPRPSMTARSKTINLPALQRGDPLIDPLPASKEKEKFLTRTRPGWLPPKCPKEEAKHLKEYQRMMSAHAQSENEKPAKRSSLFRRGKSSDVHITQVGSSSVVEGDLKTVEPQVTIEQESATTSRPETPAKAPEIIRKNLWMTIDEAVMQSIYASAASRLQIKLPKLHEHLHSQLDGNWTDVFLPTCNSLRVDNSTGNQGMTNCGDLILVEHGNDIEKAWVAIMVGFLSILENSLYVNKAELTKLFAADEGGLLAGHEMGIFEGVTSDNLLETARWATAEQESSNISGENAGNDEKQHQEPMGLGISVTTE